MGGQLVAGVAGQLDGPSGWVARLEYEILPLFAPVGTNGAIAGFGYGFEYWRSGTDNWGLSMPLPLLFGVRFAPVRATIGAGFDAFLVDQVADDTGVGFFAPLALASLALDIHGFRVGAEARGQYRWQFDADDHARWQLGVFIGFTGEQRGPIY